MSVEPHRFTVRVYYEDTDFSGVVYHANYLRFLERGRTEMLRGRGISQTDLFAGTGAAPLNFAVAEMEIAFRRPARMDDILEVETEILSIGGATRAAPATDDPRRRGPGRSHRQGRDAVARPRGPHPSNYCGEIEGLTGVNAMREWSDRPR